MSITASDFEGSYTLNQGTKGATPQPLAYGGTIEISGPLITGNGNQMLSVTFRYGTPEASTYNYIFQNNSLWAELDTANPPPAGAFFSVISLYQDPALSGYKAIYGIVTEGDPEQVGVFGAEGTGG